MYGVGLLAGPFMCQSGSREKVVAAVCGRKANNGSIMMGGSSGHNYNNDQLVSSVRCSFGLPKIVVAEPQQAVSLYFRVIKVKTNISIYFGG